MFGICLLSHIAGRREGSDKSEMVTQLLFGDAYAVVEVQEKWVKIKTHFDDYDCWISKNQHFEITEKTYGELLSAPLVLSDDLVQVVQEGSTYLPIVMGSTLPLFKDGELKIENRTFLFDGKWIEPADINKGKILEYAFMYLNAPYLWGGKSPFGIDCSGFTQMVYKLCGYNLPRDAYQQFELGTSHSFVEEAEAGDLAFFDNETGKIVHVGIVVEPGKIIHASGKVRIDNLDHQGIFNKELNQYTHRLRIIKNLL
mgnify:FL=1|jgi:hypothetical protein